MKRKLQAFGGRLKDKPFELLKNKSSGQQVEVAKQPNITNDSVAEYREEVLGKARKLIYPLKHSSRRMLKWSIGIIITAIVLFLVGSSLALYKFQSTSSFVYGVTKILPFPVAWADGRAVSYYSYLFELRHYMHYYHERVGINFNTPAGKRKLEELKHSAITQVVNRAYVAKLADKYNVKVTDQEVSRQIAISRQENFLGANKVSLVSALDYFYDWDINDFRRELKLELRDQKVAAKLDHKTTAKAQTVYQKLQDGASFESLAKKYSDDKQTAANGGKYEFKITPAGQNLAPAVKRAVYSLPEGKTSNIINTGSSLQIIKVLLVDEDTRQAAHIEFDFKDINRFVQPIKAKHPPKVFIGLD